MIFIFIYFGYLFHCWCHPRLRYWGLMMMAALPKHQGEFITVGALCRLYMGCAAAFSFSQGWTIPWDRVCVVLLG